MALTNFQNYIKIMIDRLQELEDEMQKWKNVRNIQSVTGVILDIVGEIVGEPRNGRPDDEYRIAIKFRILLNKSNGEPETVIQALRIFTEASSIKYTEVHPAKVNLYFVSSIAPPSNLRELLEQIAPSGVKIGLGWINEGPYFAVDGEGGYPPAPNTAGWGEDTFATGGGKIVEEI
jgi:hypothetical protein